MPCEHGTIPANGNERIIIAKADAVSADDVYVQEGAIYNYGDGGEAITMEL